MGITNYNRLNCVRFYSKISSLFHYLFSWDCFDSNLLPLWWNNLKLQWQQHSCCKKPNKFHFKCNIKTNKLVTHTLTHTDWLTDSHRKIYNNPWTNEWQMSDVTFKQQCFVRATMENHPNSFRLQAIVWYYYFANTQIRAVSGD